MRRDGGRWRCSYHEVVDLYGDGIADGGTRAYGGSALGGLIRTWELEAGAIHHVLALALAEERMRPGPVWPATREDGGTEGYAGSIPMGTLVAIPPDVDVEALDLTPGGHVLARALQDYGAYVVDSSSQVTFYAEPGAETSAELAQARTDVEQLAQLLLPVLNSGPDSVGGGGERRAAPAPPLAPPAG
jgi:hypothetical protein